MIKTINFKKAGYCVKEIATFQTIPTNYTDIFNNLLGTNNYETYRTALPQMPLHLWHTCNCGAKKLDFFDGAFTNDNLKGIIIAQCMQCYHTTILLLKKST